MTHVKWWVWTWLPNRALDRDFQNVFCVTDVKERKKLLGKDLLISKLNEEDDFRPGILLDIRYDMLAYFVNNGFHGENWLSFGSTRLAFNSSIDERCGCWYYVLSYNGYRSGYGIKHCYLSHISAFLFVVVIDFLYNYPTLSKLIHCLVSLTCTKYILQNLEFVVFRTNDLVLCKNYVTKSYSWKNYVVECWRQNAKFLYDMRSCSNAYYFACVRSEFANLQI